MRLGQNLHTSLLVAYGLLLLITSHLDTVTKVSDFRHMPDDMTQQQALELLLDQDPTTAAVPGYGKTP
jgi:hypothetical protein